MGKQTFTMESVIILGSVGQMASVTVTQPRIAVQKQL